MKQIRNLDLLYPRLNPVVLKNYHPVTEAVTPLLSKEGCQKMTKKTGCRTLGSPYISDSFCLESLILRDPVEIGEVIGQGDDAGRRVKGVAFR